jgi:hypothetical protein
MTWGAPALRRLLLLKLRGGWRRQWRRMRTAKGLVLTLLGVGLLLAWFSGLALHVGADVVRLSVNASWTMPDGSTNAS